MTRAQTSGATKRQARSIVVFSQRTCVSGPRCGPASTRLDCDATMHPLIVSQRRYLVGFDPRELPHHFTDVLIIGGGIAGFRSALGSSRDLPRAHCDQGRGQREQQPYAQGGIAGVLDPEDRFDNHIADTIAAGKGLCDLEVVEMVVREAPTRIAELIAWGTSFDEDNGHVALGREGGHSHARIAHAPGR